MTAKLREMELHHVDPVRLLFQSRHPGLSGYSAEPEWFTNARNGGIVLAPWLRGSVLATMEAKFVKDAYFVVVSVMGLYMTDEQASAQAQEFSNEVDGSTLDEAPDEDRQEFLLKVVDDLFPFLRAELYALSGRMQGVTGVMLQPRPLIEATSPD